MPRRFPVLGVIALASLPAALLSLSYSLLFSGFSRLEEREVAIQLKRAREAFLQEERDLAKLAGDWAVWDDTYAFMAHRDETYIRSNIANSTFSNLNLNYLIYFDTRGKVFCGWSFEPEVRQVAPITGEMIRFLEANSRLFLVDSPEGQTTGVMVLHQPQKQEEAKVPRARPFDSRPFAPQKETAVLVAAKPILTSQAEGPSRGTVVMFRYLDRSRIEQLSSMVQARISLVLPGEPLLGGQVQNIFDPDGKPILAYPADPDTMIAYAPLEDLRKLFPLYIQIRLPREIYGYGRSVVFHFIFWISAVCLAFSISLAFLFLRLNRHRIQREEALSRLAAIVQSSDDAIIAKDLDGKVTSWNAAAVRMFGFSEAEVRGTPAGSIMPAEQKEEWDRRMEKVLCGEAITHWETECLRKDGQRIMVSMTVSPTLDSLGEITGSSAIVRDITEKRRTEKAFLEQKQLLSEVFENIHEGVGIVDEQEKVIFCNPAYAGIFGCSMEQVLGHSLLEFFDPESQRLILTNTALRKTGQVSTYDLPLSLPGKPRRWMRAKVSPRTAADGTYCGAFGVLTDITDQQEVESALKKWGEIFQNTRMGIAISTSDGRLLDLMNPAYAEMHGFEVPELKGQPVEIVYDPEIRGEIQQALQLADGRNHYVFEAEHVRKDGSRFPALIDATVVRDEAGAFLYRIVNLQDLTERHKAVKEIRKLSSALEQSPVSILITDRDGMIEYVNHHFCRHTGYRPAEVVGRNLQALNPDDMSAMEYQEMWDTALRGGSWRGEFINKKKDGEPYWERIVLSSISDDEKITHLLVVREDISDRKQSEEALIKIHADLERRIRERTSELAGVNRSLRAEVEERRRTEEELKRAKEVAEMANQAKSRFLANVSHEIRTPLNAIIGFAEIIQGLPSSSRHPSYAGMIVSESELLLDLINELLDMSKVEAGKFKLEELPFDLAAVMNGVRTSMEVRAQKKGIQIRFRPEPGLPYRFVGDPIRLRQVLNNLVGNAVKFTEKGWVEVRIHKIVERKGTIALLFEVEDTGIGIPLDKQRTIFDPFEQGDDSTTRKYGGTGLGTAISKRLVEMMGGGIGVRSRPNLGSTFWFTVVLKLRDPHQEEASLAYIPPAVTEPAAAAQEGSGPPAAGRYHVLLVEDYPPNQDIARSHLSAIDCTSVCVSDGLQAVEEAARSAFDLILMDVQMPNMDGWEASRKIRGAGRNRATPILAMTASAYPEDLQKCMDAGMNDILTKPVRKALLQEAVLRWAGAQQATASPWTVPSAGVPKAEGDEPIRLSQALEEFSGKQEVLNRTLQKFMDLCRGQVAAMERAMETGDWEPIAKDAHRIKGGAANLTADPLSRSAAALEKAAREKQPEEVQSAFEDLQKQFRRLTVFLQHDGRWKNGGVECAS